MKRFSLLSLVFLPFVVQIHADSWRETVIQRCDLSAIKETAKKDLGLAVGFVKDQASETVDTLVGKKDQNCYTLMKKRDKCLRHEDLADRIDCLYWVRGEIDEEQSKNIKAIAVSAGAGILGIASVITSSYIANAAGVSGENNKKIEAFLAGSLVLPQAIIMTGLTADSIALMGIDYKTRLRLEFELQRWQRQMEKELLNQLHQKELSEKYTLSNGPAVLVTHPDEIVAVVESEKSELPISQEHVLDNVVAASAEPMQPDLKQISTDVQEVPLSVIDVSPSFEKQDQQS